MKNKSLLKRIGASLATMGLLSGLALVSGATQVSAAGVGPIYPTLKLQVDIDIAIGSVTVLNGQTVVIRTDVSINQSDPIWDDDPETFNAEAYGAPTPDAGLTVVSTTHSWSVYGPSSGGGAGCSKTSPVGTGQTFSIATLACKADINSVSYIKNITVSNTSGSSKNIVIDDTGPLLADGVAPDVMYSSDYSTAKAEVDNGASGIVIPSNYDGSITLEFPDLCFTEDVESGDVLDIDKHVKMGPSGALVDVPQASSSGPPPSMPYYSISGGGSTGALDGSTLTITSSNVSYLFMYGNLQSNALDSIGKTLEVSFDFTVAGESKVSDDCGGPGGLDFPTLSTFATGRTPGKGTVSSLKTLPTGMPNGTYENSAERGPNGDVFYYGLDSSGDTPKAVVTRIGPNGNQNLAGGPKLSQSISATSVVESFGWFGSGASNYVLVTRDMDTQILKLYYGKTANSSGKTQKTISAASVNAACGDGYTADVYVLSAPTSQPIFEISCVPDDYMNDLFFVNYIKMTGSGNTLTVGSLGLPTRTAENPCLYAAAGVNKSAKGSQVAVLLYGSIGPKTGTDAEPSLCRGSNGTSRKFVRLTTTLAASEKALSAAVFGSTETSNLQMAPGKQPNSWIVVAHTMANMMPVASPTKGYTVSSTGAVVQKATPNMTASGTITVPGTSMPNMSIDLLTPIRELPNGQWLVERTQRKYGAGVSLGIAIAKYNPANGTVTTGSVLKLTGYSPRPWFITTSSFSSKGVMSFYVLTEANKYKIVTWKSYTR